MQRRKRMTRNNLVNRTKLNMAGLGSSFGMSRSLKACVSTRSGGVKNFVMNLKKPKYYNLSIFSNNLKLLCQINLHMDLNYCLLLEF